MSNETTSSSSSSAGESEEIDQKMKCLKQRFEISYSADETQFLLTSPNQVFAVGCTSKFPNIDKIVQVSYLLPKMDYASSCVGLGKRRKTAVRVSHNLPICLFTLSDGSTVPFKPFISCRLIDVNLELVSRPSLITCPYFSGYVCII